MKSQINSTNTSTGIAALSDLESQPLKDGTRHSKKLSKTPLEDTAGTHVKRESLTLLDETKEESATLTKHSESERRNKKEKSVTPTEKLIAAQLETAARPQSNPKDQIRTNDTSSHSHKSAKSSLKTETAVLGNVTGKESFGSRSKNLSKAAVLTSSAESVVFDNIFTGNEQLRELTKAPVEASSSASGPVIANHPAKCPRISKPPADKGRVDSILTSPTRDETRIQSQRFSRGPSVDGSVDSKDQTQLFIPDDGKRSLSKKLSKPQVSEQVRKKSDRIKALLDSVDILPEEHEIPEEEAEEELPPNPGKNQFKFMKSRCGKLVNTKSWVPAWQCYNMLETSKSWKPVDESAPTRRFIRFQTDLVIWRHEHPLAQHIRWDRGLWAKCRKRTTVSSTWGY